MGTSPDKSPHTLKFLASLGMSEAITRVALYGKPVGARGTDESHVPVRFQSIVKHVNAGNAWAVAVRDDADEAERDARTLFVELYGKPHKKASLAKARAAPPAEPDPDDDGDIEGLI